MRYGSFIADIRAVEIAELQSRLGCCKQRAGVAQRAGIDKLIICNPSVQPSPDLLARTVSAIIAAVYLDSGGNIPTTIDAMKRLG
jgi:dsRNA-specific ribonuclease